jgi:thioesterase domain-containing protein
MGANLPGPGRSDVTPRDATDYLHRHIPLTRALGAEVVVLDELVAEIRAPLAPNLNHRMTAFGGSLSTLAILSGWTVLHFALRAAGVEARLVIQRAECDFLLPVDGEFVARSELEAPARDRFVRTLARYRRARLSVSSRVRQADASCVDAHNHFVALQ